MINFDAEYTYLGPNSLKVRFAGPPQANCRKKFFKVLS